MSEKPARRRRLRYRGTHPRRFDERYKELDPDRFPEIQDHVRAQGRTPAGTHVPVLLDEVLAALDPRPGDVVADGTLGHGGHALELLRRIGSVGRLIGLDVDARQLERTSGRLLADQLAWQTNGNEAAGRAAISLHRSHFAGLGKVMAREGLDGFDVIFADLGVSSMQIDDPRRGFSYKFDGPLDMRMDDRLPRTAAHVLATLSEAELSTALADLADEPFAGAIASAIVRRRGATPLSRTGQLVDVVFEARRMTKRQWRERPLAQKGQLHPAARTFQAVRMLVNDELGGLAQFLRVAPYCLKPGGRFGIISFHSGEDRLVAEAMENGAASGHFDRPLRGPVRPRPAEVAANPRSRSAIFRCATKSSHA